MFLRRTITLKFISPNPKIRHKTTTMPLVVPGIMSGNKSKTEEWQEKLMGKKIGEHSDEVVRLLP
jgi:hypothetical protein